MDLTATGLGSGLDIKGIVEKLVAAERQPAANRLNLQEARANAELSALGKFKSALSSFRDSLANLSEIEKFQQRAAAVSDDTVLQASADGNAVPGQYTVEVNSLATRQKLASGAFAGPDSTVGTGTLAITVNGKTSAMAIVDGAATLADIRDTINAAPDNPGVLATIVNAADGAHLVLSSRETGASNAITITANGGDGGLAALSYDAQAGSNPMTELEAAADASVTIDGFTVTSSRNTVAGAIEGVSLDLLAAAPGSPVNLAISYDETAANAAVGAFVNAYNALVDTITEVTRYDAESGEAAPLLGDPTVRGIKDTLRRELGLPQDLAGASFRTLAEIGITTEASGKLKLDTARLGGAITENFDGVGALFAGTEGVAVRLQSRLETALGTTSSLSLQETRLKDRLDVIGEARTKLDERMQRVQDRLMKQYNAMDRLVASLQNTSSFLARELAG